ncbi:hypothetical protein EV714DRAFT_222510 [Schizophyllum commune]
MSASAFSKKRSRAAASAISTGTFVPTRARPSTTISQGTSFQSRRRVIRTEVDVPLPKRARVFPSADDWTPTTAQVSFDDLEEEYANPFVTGEGPACEEGGEVVECTTGKRKRYESDDPARVWRQYKQMFLEELLRHEGLASDLRHPACSSCDATPEGGSGLIKCDDCGVFLECATCCVRRHGHLPHHRIQRWNGDFWDKSVTLQEIGLVYQLGHGGLPCPAPAPRTSLTAMTLITPTRISRVAICYCGCSSSSNTTRVQQLLREGWYPATTRDPNTCATFAALDHFELLAVAANVNVRDYISTLERADNALNLIQMPDVYKAFGRMSRQWGFLLRMKRAGRGHDRSGIDGTVGGGAAVRCWACPRDGVNMPSDWREDESQFIHTLFLSNDANFRLKNRLRHNARPDGPLGPGLGCIVEPTKYLEHVKRSVSESDVSTCISFAALMEKNTKVTTGCRVSGAGATSCTRHECIRPAGFGDLQKGERYTNMDYIFWSAVADESIDNIMVTYDIGCQWKVNLKTRVDSMPRHLQDAASRVSVDVRLPVWHGNVHELSCRTANSVRYARGAGKPDGEGPERIWASMNSIAYATKEMGAGVREDTIERPTLARRHMLACRQAILRKEELKDLEQDLEPSTLAGWRDMYESFENDPSARNPFKPHGVDPPSEQAVKAQLVQEEADAARRGKAPMRATSKTTFIAAALQLEDQQRHITSLANDVSLAAVERQRSLQEARVAWFKRLGRLRQLQEVYMPGAVVKIRAEEDARPADSSPPNAESIKLWLPSDMTRQEREEGCVEGLQDIETRLRVAQATDALKKIREQMYAKHYLINERNANVVGQRDSTRARKVIERVGDHIVHHRNKYRQARSALHRLEAPDAYPAFKELKDSDLTIDDDREVDGASTDALATTGSRGAKVIPASRKTDVGTSRQDREIAAVRRADSRRSMTSWIWTCLGGPVPDEETQIHEAIRVEWAKARARAERWREEVLILEEEMRRVLRYLQWAGDTWLARANASPTQDMCIRAGFRAYALRQRALLGSVAQAFHARWTARMPDLTLVQSVSDESSRVAPSTYGGGPSTSTRALA